MNNKVIIIAPHRETDIYTKPLGVYKEFKGRNIDTEIISIFDKNDNLTDVYLKEYIEKNKKTKNKDIYLFINVGNFDSFYLGNQGNKSNFWVQDSEDDPQSYFYNSPKCLKFNLTITSDYSSYLQYKNTYKNNVKWFPHFADTRYYYPMEVEKKYLAVTTRGPNRDNFMDILVEHSNGSILNKTQLFGVEHTKILNMGYMVFQHSRWGEITRRIFEGMACGQLVITDRLHENKKLHELFIENQDIVYYDSMEDCINKMNYFYKNKEEREYIAKNGMTKVLNKHTQKHYVDLIFSEYEKWLTS